jgi:hypothetical protein
MARRSDNPTPAALRSRRSYALRNANCACSQLVTSPRVLGMLMERGLLRGCDIPSDVEVEVALTRFAFMEADDKNFTRVSAIMRERWHSARNLECCR